jgi:hypothetical protein
MKTMFGGVVAASKAGLNATAAADADTRFRNPRRERA